MTSVIRWPLHALTRNWEAPSMSDMAMFRQCAIYYGSMPNLGRIGFAKGYVFLSLIVLFVPPLLTPASVPRATGHFEEYCDGVGIFLAKLGGAPASGKLVFFSYMGFPGGTFGGEYIGQGKWSDVSVFADG